MHSQPESVNPETLTKIHLARCLSDRPREDRMVQPLTLGRLLSERAAATPDRNWLTFYDDSGPAAAYTCAEFEQAARRVAAFLQQTLGLRRGDRVATLMANDPRTAQIYFGAWMLGLTVVPINTGEDNDRIAAILEHSEAKAIFMMDEQIDRCEALHPRLPGLQHCVPVGGPARPGVLSFDDAVAEQAPLTDLPDLPADTECLIVYTSGTMGAPKGVVLDQYNVLADAHGIAEWNQYGPEDRAMGVLPIHQVVGTIVTLVTPLYSGGSVVLHRRFHAQTFWKTLAEEQSTWVSVVPTVLAFLCERRDDLSRLNLKRLRHIVCGAGPLTVELARRFHHLFGFHIVHAYGLSEATCYTSFLPPLLDEATYRYWMMECGFPSIGCPICVNEMAIHDAEGNPLPPDTRGEIVVRGHNVMRGYLKHPDANAETFAHAWLRTGDEGFYRLGQDGLPYFFITGRLKDLIIRGGINYSPFDIDEILSAIPGVKTGVAVGFENGYYGEEVGAYVVREEEASLTEEDVLRACRERLPFAKSPKVVVFGDAVPTTPTGQYRRSQLKPHFEKWKDTQFRER
jgi:long-chain acyl-CoA synthetase